MSREVDPNAKNLSDDDKIYLIQRGLMPTSVMSVQEQRKLVDPDLASLSLEERANTGDVNTDNLSIEQLEELLEARRAAEVKDPRELMKPAGEAAATRDGDDEDESDGEPLEPPYDQYTNAQLRAELDRRNEDRDEDEKLPLSGSKAELVSRLEEDDSEDDEDDEE